MHADPILPRLVASMLVLLVIGLVLRRLRQPHVVAYLLAGIVLGPHGLALYSDTDAISRLGDLGLILLLFFVGMKMSLPRLAASWRVAVVGTALQIALSLLAVSSLGLWLSWPAERVVLVGFVISLSSTAVVVSMLHTWGHLSSQLGRDVTGILIVQDLSVAPMVLTLGFLAQGPATSLRGMAAPVLGSFAVVGFGVWLLRQDRIRLPFAKRLRDDHELQVFAAALVCFAAALTTALLELSTALGAFLAGIVISSAEETEWVTKSLEPFRVILVALFFVSIGLLLDVPFVRENWPLITLLAGGVLLTNTFVNAGIVRVFGRTWRHSFFAGAVLAQAGDFSFVLAAIGLDGGLITSFGYQLTISVIFVSLLVSPFWVRPFRRLFELSLGSGDGAASRPEARGPAAP